MIWLSNSTLARLRDQLQSRGQRPSLVLPAGGAGEVGATPETTELLGVLAEYGPLCEAMYLMMSADGRISNDEREVLKGALRNLSGDSIRSAHIESMLDTAGKNVADEGRDARLAEVVSQLHEDPARAEVAFVLAAAIAFADNAIADEENETLNSLAEGLGIDEARANQLLDGVEADLARADSSA
jgi:tellurite resistance protein